MDETQSLFPNLPPKRKPALANSANAKGSSELTEHITPKEISEAEEIPFTDEDIDPELLLAFEQAVKDTPTSVEIDELCPPRGTAVEAPIVGDCVDPLAVPVTYLLEQARQAAQSDDLPPETADLDQTGEQEK